MLKAGGTAEKTAYFKKGCGRGVAAYRLKDAYGSESEARI